MKKLLSIVMSALILVMILFVSVTVFAGDKSQINKFNVVFVLDTSISMKTSDSSENRFEATDLFLGMLANEGNNVGLVLFNGEISSQEIKGIDGLSSKKDVSNAIRESKLSYCTDIGGGLLAAVNMLDEEKDESLPSIIILLSDGNTDFGSETDRVEASIDNKETAVETARKNGYKIYTVSLNSRGDADSKELRQIANATGGIFEEVSDSGDLKNVFDKFYTQIYGTKSDKLADESLPTNGVMKQTFNVSKVGVEEVNIVIFGNVKECSLTSPNGEKLSNNEIDNISFSAKTFKLLKITNPIPGEWSLFIKGDEGDNVTIVKSYNTNLNLKTTVNSSEPYKVNSPISINVKMYEDNKAVIDIGKYNQFVGKLTISDYDGNNISTLEPKKVSQDGFEFEFIPSELNTYYANITVDSGDVYAETETLTFDVGNTAPIASKDTIKKHVYIWPFLIKTNSTIDLSDIATDTEDTTLNYKIDSSTWSEEDYTLDGYNLTIDSFKNVSKGSFEVQAYDSQGAYCTFDVNVTSTNVGVLAMILILVAGIVVIVVFALLANKLKNSKFMGEVYVTDLETGRESVSTKSKGSIKLAEFDVGNTGLDGMSRFQATGKSYIYFQSKKPVICDSMLNPAKKVKIDNNIEVRIYSDSERTKGIEVRFVSYTNNSMY